MPNGYQEASRLGVRVKGKKHAAETPADFDKLFAGKQLHHHLGKLRVSIWAPTALVETPDSQVQALVEPLKVVHRGNFFSAKKNKRP